MKLLIAHKGDEASNIALDIALILRKTAAHVNVFHIKDMNKNTDTWSKMRESIDCKLAARIPPNLYEIDFVTKNPSETIRATFNRYTNEGRVNLQKGVVDNKLVFVGSQIHANVKNDNVTLLGSVSDIAMRTCHYSIVVCRQVPETRIMTYMVLVDGTRRSEIAYEKILLIAKPRDCINVVYASGEDFEKSRKIESEYLNSFEINGLDNATFTILPHDSDHVHPIHSRLSAHINEVSPTFCVVSPDLDIAADTRSISERLIRECQYTNFIIHKNEHSSQSMRHILPDTIPDTIPENKLLKSIPSIDSGMKGNVVEPVVSHTEPMPIISTPRKEPDTTEPLAEPHDNNVSEKPLKLEPLSPDKVTRKSSFTSVTASSEGKINSPGKK